MESIMVILVLSLVELVTEIVALFTAIVGLPAVLAEARGQRGG